MRSQNIPTSQSYQTRVSKLPLYDQNDLTRLLFKEEFFVGGKKTGEVALHKQGHLFKDVKPNHFEPQHYHGKGGEHFTYKEGSPRSSNMSGNYH